MKAGTLRIISLLTLAAIWEVAGRTGNAHLLPPLSKVVTVWMELLVTGQLFQALAISLQALFIGFFVSVLFGVPLGLLMGRYRRLESFLDIYMTALAHLDRFSLRLRDYCGQHHRWRAQRRSNPDGDGAFLRRA